MSIVNIPNPCPLKLNQLTPVNGGYYCGQCSKVVIDFREKSNEEILSTHRETSDDKICGVYKSSQVKRPYSDSFAILKFVASLFLVFGMSLFTSCSEDKPDHTVMGEICTSDSSFDQRPFDSVIVGDSVVMESSFEGKTDSVHIADSVSKASR